jgi:uncharacterized glyoxalase superfamily protein PhnB
MRMAAFACLGREVHLLESGGPATRADQLETSRDEGWPAIYYLYPENVVALHAEAKQKDLLVIDLRVTCYGMQEFEVRDPDGHILWFGLVWAANR